VSIDPAWLAAQFPDLQGLAPLSVGGQKEVFSATHSSDGDVVLKVIKPTQDAEWTRREILAARQLSAKRVPAVLGDGVIATSVGPCVWLREQRILGPNVRDLLQSGPLPPLTALRLGLHVLECLRQAEALGVVHRDVKPDNIMQDQVGAFWLLDFGIARHLTLQSLTQTASPFGKFTVGYAPPEQFRNLKADIDGRADLFALGVTLYECLTGLNPFRNPPANDLTYLQRVVSLVVLPVTPAIATGADVRDLVHTMMQKRRDLRPRSVSEAYDWMRDICSKENVF
jgi:serine/threonine protein kinase